MGTILRSRVGLALLGFLAIAAFYLITEHTAHTLGILPYAVLLLCPLMHVFMHGGHGTDHSGHGKDHGEQAEGASGNHTGHGEPPQQKGGAS